jgi:YD repeat-containing protein
MRRVLAKHSVLKINVRLSLLMSLALGGSAIAFCQNDFKTSVIPPAPTSAVFLRYGNDQPALQTGTVNIPIRLFDIQAKGLNIPLTLTYQTSGINIADVPYPAGYGWVFSPAFRITRTVLGRPDEFFQFVQLLGGEEYETVKPGIVSDQTYNLHGLNYSELFDTQKDIFTLHLPSGSYNFFINKNGNNYEIISAGHLLKIEALAGFTGFKVTDDDGIIYMFGYDGNTSFLDFTEPTELTYGCSAWMLREIVLPNSEKIVFTWQKVNTNAYAVRTNTSISIADYKVFDCVSSSYEISDYGGIVDHSTNSGANALMLQKIEYPNGIVDLTYKSSQDPFLQELKIRNKKNEIVKTISLMYGSETGGNNRLLQSLTIQDQVYKFQYDGNRFYPQTTALDYWGFYNGKTDNLTLIPRMTLKLFSGAAPWGSNGIPIVSPNISVPLNYADRSVDSDYMKAFMLTRIIYPTGGYSDYEYEPHYFPGQSVQSVDLFLQNPEPLTFGGGLRVSKISTYSSANTPSPIIKTYKYGINENGLANISAAPTLETFIDEYLSAYEVPQPSCHQNFWWANFRKMDINALSNYSKFLIFRSPIWYNRVVEYINSEMKTEYNFDYSELYNVTWQSVFKVKRPYIFRYNNLFNNGPKLSSTINYKKVGQNYVPLQQTVNEYETIDYGNLSISNVIIDRSHLFTPLYNPGPDLYPNTNMGTTSYIVPSYQLLLYSNSVRFERLKKVTTTQYENETLSNHQEYFYRPSGIQQITKVRTGTSIDGKESSVTYKYPVDFTDAIYQQMVAKGILSPVIEEKNYKSVAGVETLLSTTQTSYKQIGSLIVKDNIKASTGSLTPEIRAQFNQYDASGNILEQQKTNDVVHSYLWGYNKSYPIAEAINAKSNEIFFSGFEEGGWEGTAESMYYMPITAYDDTRAHSGRYSGRIDNAGPGEFICHSNQWLNISLSQSTKFKYSGWIYSTGPGAEIFLFMRTATEQNYYTYVTSVGTNVTNKWVYIEGEYTVPANITKLNIRIDNNAAGTIWYDDIRLHPSSAQMVTYTYEPLIGMTSQTDINNRTAYYEYDGFGRLSLIRDQDGNILKKYCYNYAGQPEQCSVFESAVINGYYYSQNCGSQTPEPYYVSVPAGMFTSTSSQLDANQQAQQYAQSLANQNGTCQAPDIDLWCDNYADSDFLIELENTETGLSYYFEVFMGATGILGSVPEGVYNITITPYNFQGYYFYSAGCGFYGNGYDPIHFYNVTLNSSCNYFSITP